MISLPDIVAVFPGTVIHWFYHYIESHNVDALGVYLKNVSDTYPKPLVLLEGMGKAADPGDEGLP